MKPGKPHSETDMSKSATFRFYEELNDFLPPERKKTPFTYSFEGRPSVKDAIEAIGVPHTEVDLILVNGEPVTFGRNLEDGDVVSVYPVFESLDISSVARLRGKPLREPRFILDVHLGKLAKYLRMLGFDTLYENDYDDPEIIERAKTDGRIILTRDLGILKNSAVTRGYWLRSKDSREQLKEVMARFNLRGAVSPFTRCMECNGTMEKVDKSSIEERLEPKTKRYFDEFFRCSSCGKIYWKGSHFERMKKLVKELTEDAP